VTRTVLFLCSGNYYRSRFAEAVFNHEARRLVLPWEAASAGLAWPAFGGNPGPISAHTVAALRARGIELSEPHRMPRAVTATDLAAAERIVAMKEAEHRVMMETRFPSYVPRVTFWHIDDVDVAPPSVALPELESHVASLLRDLSPP
jgi:protein-tyrosine-phosphatase